LGAKLVKHCRFVLHEASNDCNLGHRVTENATMGQSPRQSERKQGSGGAAISFTFSNLGGHVFIVCVLFQGILQCLQLCQKLGHNIQSDNPKCITNHGAWEALVASVIVRCVRCVLIGVYCGGSHGQFRQKINHPRNQHPRELLGHGPCIHGEIMAKVAWVFVVLAKLFTMSTAVHINYHTTRAPHRAQP
jgi:hypothetical protein